MALDTLNKRLAVLGWEVGSLPSPDGAFDSGDREQMLGMPRFSDDPAPPPTRRRPRDCGAAIIRLLG